ncbi:large neutral amino acids transporter small subunit 1-like [Haliotis rufescens]|uniref:large neutral amino acids transporter small subunit 1-like n=1 Tax=Haliotis rufescens TaxID=6454 RepID=UPI00201EE47E|nr:large neutral amino acids transporter small subunit 1-like [Haliotis rufescens]
MYVCGTGIFISPTVVLEGVGSSVGLSLLVWTLCGVVTYCAAMCYAEYGTRVKKSGGTYTYIREAFGDLAGFVFLWTQLVLVRPLSVVLASLASAEYIMRPLFQACPDMAPTTSKVMLGFVILGFFVMANMYSVRLGARLQTIATVCKVFALLSIIVGGLLHLCQGHTENFSDPFRTTTLKPGNVAMAIYAGLYAYGGWDNVNMAVEEVMNPHRTIPICILGGLAIPTLAYILGNVAYHAVLTNDEILSGIAVAVTFGERKLGLFKWIILPCVAISAGGIANAVIFTSSRLNFVGGRDGLFPRFLGMVNVQRRTPQPSIITLFLVAVLVMCLGDVRSVIGAYSFFKAGGEFLGVLGMFRIRRKHPATKQTYKVHWLFPVIYVVFFLALSITAVVYDPRTYLVPFLIMLLGVPLYYMSRSRWWQSGHLATFNRWIIMICHRLLLCEHASQEAG